MVSRSDRSQPGRWCSDYASSRMLYTEVPKEEGREQLQEHLDKCTEWAKQWMMEFNVAKCKVLHAGRTNRMKEYTMEGNILEKVQEEKDLGVMVHKAMNGSRQVAEAVKKANRAPAQIIRTISNKETDTVIPLHTNMCFILEEGYQRT